RPLGGSAAVAPAPWKAGCVYLIVGGAGAIGRTFAADICAKAPGACVVLTGRRSPDESLLSFLSQLQARGAKVEHRAVDVADESAVRALVGEILAQHGRLDGVIHAAGTLSDGWLVAKAPGDLDHVLRPK